MQYRGKNTFWLSLHYWMRLSSGQTISYDVINEVLYFEIKLIYPPPVGHHSCSIFIYTPAFFCFNGGWYNLFAIITCENVVRNEVVVGGRGRCHAIFYALYTDFQVSVKEEEVRIPEKRVAEQS